MLGDRNQYLKMDSRFAHHVHNDYGPHGHHIATLNPKARAPKMVLMWGGVTMPIILRGSSGGW